MAVGGRQAEGGQGGPGEEGGEWDWSPQGKGAEIDPACGLTLSGKRVHLPAGLGHPRDRQQSAG